MRVRKLTNVREDHCPACKAGEVREDVYSDDVDFRGITFSVQGLKRNVCAKCGRFWQTDDQLAENESTIKVEYAIERDRVRARQGLLTALQIRNARLALGIANQRDASVIFGGGPNSFNKYESGEVLQSVAMDKLLRLSVEIGRQSVAFLRDGVSISKSPKLRHELSSAGLGMRLSVNLSDEVMIISGESVRNSPKSLSLVGVRSGLGDFRLEGNLHSTAIMKIGA